MTLHDYIEIGLCVLVAVLACGALAMLKAIKDLRWRLRYVETDVKSHREDYWEEKRYRMAMCDALGLEWDSGSRARFVVKGKKT